MTRDASGHITRVRYVLPRHKAASIGMSPGLGQATIAGVVRITHGRQEVWIIGFIERWRE